MPRQYPRIAIQAIKLNSSPFEGVSYTPQQEDMSLLANSLKTNRELNMRAAESIGGIDNAATTLYEKVGDDLEARQWIDDKLTSAKEYVNNHISNGDYTLAINAANQLGKSFATDPTFQNLQAYKTQRDNWLKSLDSEGISPITKKRLLEENPYNFEDASTGNRFEGSTVYKDIDIRSLVQSTAEKLITPDVISTSTKTSTSNTSSKGGSSHANEKSHALTEVTADEILGLLKQRISEEPALRETLQQKYADIRYLFDDAYNKMSDESLSQFDRNTAKETYEKYASLYYGETNNGGKPDPVSFEEFLQRTVYNELGLKASAYKKETTATVTSDSTTSYGGGGGSDNPRSPQQPNNTPTPTNGAGVIRTRGTGVGGYGSGGSGTGGFGTGGFGRIGNAVTTVRSILGQ